VEEKLKQKQKENDNQKAHLFRICLELDCDGSGTLDVHELLDAFDTHENFRNTLQMMDIQKEELRAVFKVLDKDGSGDVDYKEFCSELHMIKNRDTRTMLTFLKLGVSEVTEKVEALALQCGQAFEEFKDTVQASQYNSKLLASIDERLSRLESEGENIKTDACRKEGCCSSAADGAAIKSEVLGLGLGVGLSPDGGPVAPPKPNEDRVPSTDMVLGDLKGLGHSTRELANLKGLIVKRLEEQVTMLTRHAGALATIGVTMKCGATAGTAAGGTAQAVACSAGGGQSPGGAGGGFDLPDTHLVKVGGIVEKLRENMDRELSALLKDVDMKLDSGQAMLARNGELLATLSKDLGCVLPSDGESRGFHMESKASSRNKYSRERSPSCACITVERPDERAMQIFQPARG